MNDFKEMLEKLNLNPATATWENTLMKIANDPRYRLLKTVGEKKRVFNEFLQEKENVFFILFFNTNILLIFSER